jgi:hypothetical protein
MPTGIAAYLGDEDENTVKITRKGQLKSTESYDLVKNPSRLIITSVSGGVDLPTMDIGKLMIRSESGNDEILVGGVVDDAPYSGHGFPFWGGETVTLPIQNINQVRLFAVTSGQRVALLGFGTAEDVRIEPNDPPASPETVPPVLVSNFPLNGASSVETTSIVSARFSEEILSGSANVSGFTLRTSGSNTNVSGFYYLSPDDPSILNFDPVSGLTASSVYVARVGRAIKDLAGNQLNTSGSWSFTIAAAPPVDTTRPVVSGFVPVSGSTSQATSTTPRVVFSERMLSGKINSTFVQLRLPAGTVVSNSVTLDPSDQKTVTLAVSGNLLATNTAYNVVVLSGVQDLAGNNLSGNVSGRFTTVAALTVTGHTPASGATNVSTSVIPSFVFSANVLSGTANSTFFRINVSGGSALAASVTLGSGNKTVLIDPTATLASSTMYQISALSGVKDTGQNNLTTPVTSRFTTAAPPLTIVYNVTGTSTNQLFDGDDENEAVAVVNTSSALRGKIIKQVRVPLRRQGTITGDVNCLIRKADGSHIRIGTALDASTVSTTFADYTYTSSTNTYALVAGDRITIEFGDASSDASNYIEVRRNNADVFDGVNTIRSIAGGDRNWEDQSEREWVGIMWA